MLGITCFSSLLLMCRIYTVSSRACTQLSSGSGIISNEKYASSYKKCWKISVPQNSKVHIWMELFSSDTEDCTDTVVEISLNNEDEMHVFCSAHDNSNELILDGDFTVTHKISHYYNIRSQFSMIYQTENLPCAEKDAFAFRCNDGTCIPESQTCDGIQQCPDGSDEDCGNGPGVVLDLKESLFKCLQWMKNQWSDTTGWQENTHRGITAWFLAAEGNDTNIYANEKIMIKQLEIETLAYLSTKETDPLTANQLSMFINALTVSCLDPYNFHGHDLVKLLQEKDELSSHHVTYLALCNAGSTLADNATAYLNYLLNTSIEYPFLLDVQAMAVLTLSCLQDSGQRNSNVFPQTNYEDAVRKLKELQLEDGSFGNVYTTAIVTQALLSAGQESSEDWNYIKAMNYLTHHLNSSSVDFLEVYIILPLLNGKCLSHIRRTNCPNVKQRNLVSNVKSKLGPKMRVNYSLYIGDEKDTVHTISLRVPQNSTVYEVMLLAQDADSKFKFQGKQMGETLYVYGIAHILNDLEDGKFWFLSVGKDAESMVLTNESPDKVILQDGAHVALWYKKARF